MFTHMKISTKLLLAFSLVSIITLIVGINGYMGSSSIGDSLEKIAGNRTPGILGLGYINEAQTGVLRSERSLLQDLPETDRTRLETRLQENWDAATKGWKIYEPLPQTKEEKVLWKEFVSTWKTWKDGHLQVMALLKDGKPDKARALSFGTPAKSFNASKALLVKILDLNAKYASQEYKAAQHEIRSIKLVSITMMLAALVVSLSLGVVIASAIRKPLEHGVAIANRIAGGDLTVEVEAFSRDETGQLMSALQNMVIGLRTLISQTTAISTGIASASHQLHSTANQIASGSEKVAMQSHTVATASEEMAATSSDIARNCALAVEASRQTTEAALQGSGIVNETIAGMSLIAAQVSHTSAAVIALGSRSDQIGEIVGTIEDIADQTNLLALNAAIEAARAGEQGRGFAVVADEVRALAERTTGATKEISVMIKAIQKETQEAVQAMALGVREVDKGMAASERSSHALGAILNRISEVTMQINQIATAAEEQTATTGEVTNNIHQITIIVQQTAHGAEATAQAAAGLDTQSQQLQELVRRFKLF